MTDASSIAPAVHATGMQVKGRVSRRLPTSLLIAPSPSGPIRSPLTWRQNSENRRFMGLETVFLDAGGVLVYPNWTRVCATLARYGVHADPLDLAAAEPLAKRRLDVQRTVNATNDASRGWLYFNLILDATGVARSEATDAALADLHGFHMTNNLWEHVPVGVPDVL